MKTAETIIIVLDLMFNLRTRLGSVDRIRERALIEKKSEPSVSPSRAPGTGVSGAITECEN